MASKYLPLAAALPYTSRPTPIETPQATSCFSLTLPYQPQIFIYRPFVLSAQITEPLHTAVLVSSPPNRNSCVLLCSNEFLPVLCCFFFGNLNLQPWVSNSRLYPMATHAARHERTFLQRRTLRFKLHEPNKRNNEFHAVNFASATSRFAAFFSAALFSHNSRLRDYTEDENRNDACHAIRSSYRRILHAEHTSLQTSTAKFPHPHHGPLPYLWFPMVRIKH